MPDKELFLDGYGGDLGVSFDPRDFTDLDVISLVDQLPNINDGREFPKLNQGLDKITQSACTIFGALGDCSYNTNTPTSNQEGKQFSLEARDKGTLDLKNGGNSNTNSNEVRRMWNRDNPSSPVVYSLIYRSSDVVKKLIDKGYLLGISLSVTHEYHIAKKDGIIKKGEKTAGKEIVGHRPMGLVKAGSKYILVDNYYGSKRNYTEYENWDTIADQFTEGNFRPFCYALIPVSSLAEAEEIKERSKNRKKHEILCDSMSVAWSGVDSKDKKALEGLAPPGYL